MVAGHLRFVQGSTVLLLLLLPYTTLGIIFGRSSGTRYEVHQDKTRIKIIMYVGHCIYNIYICINIYITMGSMVFGRDGVTEE